MGRRKKEVDEEQVVTLAEMQCTMAEIASVCKISVETLRGRFCDTIKNARENGLCSLRRVQFEKAIKGNVTMMIWLGKQYLGQQDKQEITPGVTRAVIKTLAGPNGARNNGARQIKAATPPGGKGKKKKGGGNG